MKDLSVAVGPARPVVTSAPTATECGLLIVSTSLRYPGPVAVWILAAGWGASVRERFGEAWIVTPEGIVTPEQALAMATDRKPQSITARKWHIPQVVGTLRRDLRTGLAAWRFRSAAARGPWSDARVRFVWQYHALFQKAGFVASRNHGVPLVLFVDAPVVWEGERWGVRRPGWGRLLEHVAEVPQLRSADVVACVSAEVADAVRARGVAADRIIVTPCGVNTDHFTPQAPATAIREAYGLEDRFVVGWVGSFRRFHGVDLLLECFAELERRRPDAVLLLVGDGLDRGRLQRFANEKGIRNAVFTGSVSYADMPRHVAAMDVGVVLDPGVAGFHYSPLKLREYMASGLAVVAPRSGEISRTLQDGKQALLIEPGSKDDLLGALIRLHDDQRLRKTLGMTAREYIVRTGTWGAQLERTEQVLAGLG